MDIFDIFLIILLKPAPFPYGAIFVNGFPLLSSSLPHHTLIRCTCDQMPKQTSKGAEGILMNIEYVQ